MNISTVKFLLAATALAHAAGCTPLAPRLDGEFGKSLAAIKASQTINPQGAILAGNPDMDGAAAAATIERYQKSFVAPPPQQNVFTIGLGAGSN